MSRLCVAASKPAMGLSLLLSMAVLVFSPNAFATDANELSGVAIQRGDSGVSLLIDAQKTPGAKVQKQKNGTVVITLPKTQLPKAYQEYGMPELKSGDTGLSARIQNHGDGLKITVPKGATVPLNIRFRNGGLTTVTHSQTAAPTASKTTPKATTAAKPKPVAKATPKAAVKPVTAVPAKPPAKSATASTSVTKPTASAAKPVASNAVPAKTTPQGGKATPIDSSPLALPQASTKGAQAAAVSGPPQTPSAATMPPAAETLPPAATTKPVDLPKTKPMIPETDVNAPLTPAEETSSDPLTSIQNQATSFLQGVFGSSGSSDIQQWIFPLLAIFGAGLMLVSLVLIVLRRLMGGGSKRPKTPKVKAQPMPETTGQYSDDAFFAGSPAESTPAASTWGEVPETAPPATHFDDYLEPPAAAMAQPSPMAAPPAITPVSNSPVAPTQGASQGVDERFARLAQRSSRLPRR